MWNMKLYDLKKVAAAFNEWQRRYLAHPEQFEGEMETIVRSLKEHSEGREPTYGEVCAAYLDKLIFQK